MIAKQLRGPLAAALMAALLGAAPAGAQDAAPRPVEHEEPFFDEDQLSEDAQRAVREFLELVEPVLRKLELVIQDLPRYEAPEILPNGDIIIRRKRDEPGLDGPEAPDHEPAPPSDGRTKT